MQWTLWPLPPPSPVTVAVALPASDIAESMAIFDGGEISQITTAAAVDSWDDSDADAWADEHQAARDAAPDPEHFGYFAHYRLQLTETAPTHAIAIRNARARLQLPIAGAPRSKQNPPASDAPRISSEPLPSTSAPLPPHGRSHGVR
jgi:hypothetical protein